LLRFVHNRSARLLEQVVKSALGNAEFRGARDIEELIVSESRVDGGPIMKRIMPRARGTAYPIKRRIAHIHVTLSDGQEEAAE
jgi:large subunit ribosomal protein L22